MEEDDFKSSARAPTLDWGYLEDKPADQPVTPGIW